MVGHHEFGLRLSKRRDWSFSWILVGFLYVRVWVRGVLQEMVHMRLNPLMSLLMFTAASSLVNSVLMRPLRLP